jgi:PAS domain S-box-containing protein
MASSAPGALGTTPRSLPGGLRIAALAALSYLLAAGFGRLLAIPPGWVTPLDPAAGIALAWVLVHGRRGLAGIAVGALAFHFYQAHTHAWAGSVPLWTVGLAGAALVQAGFGAWAVRRKVAQPLTLTEPTDILSFVALAGLLASTVMASTVVVLLRIAGDSGTAEQTLTTALTAWAGNALGTLLAAPALLTLIGRPRPEWRPRQASLGMTLTAVLALLAVGMVQVTRHDLERARADFEREAASAAAALDYRLQEPLLALQAFRSVFVASENVTSTEMRLAAERWLQPPTHIQAIGWSERVPRGEVAAFTARAQAEGAAGYAVRDRGADGRLVPTTGAEVVAIRYIEPLAGNAAALGVNALSIPAARDAIERAARSDLPAATGGFRLSQDAETSRQTGVVVYHAIYRGRPASPAARMAALRGVVFVTLRMDDLLRAAFSGVPAGLSVCILDGGGGAPQRLAGPAGCEREGPGLQRDQRLQFADRPWTLRIVADGGTARLNSNAWVLSVIGVGAAALLGALLLGMTGRTQRIEAAVAERTAALSDEMRERELAEAAMRESEQRFRTIFNNVPIGVVYTDLQGRLQHVNPHFVTLTGYTGDIVQRMDVFDYLHPEDAAQERVLIQRLLKGELAVVRGHRRVLRRDGEMVWVQATMNLLRGPDGEPRRLVGVMEDITEHLLLVEAERAREQAEAANLAKSEFLSRMSHELRTPLNAMLGFAQLLEMDQRHPLASGQRPWVAQIQQAGWHLLDMINDVLDLSRIESGNVRLEPVNLDLQALAEASVALVAADAARRGITIDYDFAGEAVAAQGDITRVKQILINLLSNAVKYNQDGGRIGIATRRDGERVTIVVSDTGLGMSPEQLSELFQPFNRLGRERTNLEGTGIGLVISRRLAELMGGSLHAESHAGSGSSFVLTLPAAVEHDTVRADLDPGAVPTGQYHRRVVHYVEDNETNIEVMRGILAQRPQVQMSVSMTGLDALAALRSTPPDVILLDMNLPDIDGLELLKHLKSDPGTAGIAVVVVSADALPAQIDAALDAGALRYLTKPVSVAEVLRVLDEILQNVDTRIGSNL